MIKVLKTLQVLMKYCSFCYFSTCNILCMSYESYEWIKKICSCISLLPVTDGKNACWTICIVFPWFTPYCFCILSYCFQVNPPSLFLKKIKWNSTHHFLIMHTAIYLCYAQMLCKCSFICICKWCMKFCHMSQPCYQLFTLFFSCVFFPHRAEDVFPH